MNKTANRNGKGTQASFAYDLETERQFLSDPLYNGETLRFTAMNIGKDAPMVTGWMYQPEIVARICFGRSIPLAFFEVKKMMEAWQKDVQDSGHTFVFSLRPLQDERILGLFVMQYIQWPHATGHIGLVIGDSKDRERYGREALDMALHYSFAELNLFRVALHIGEDEAQTLAFFQERQLTLEVRQRQAVYRAGRYFDLLSFGMLRSEWEILIKTGGLEMTIENLEGRLVHLKLIDMEKDPQVLSQWDRDSEYQRLLFPGPIGLYSPEMIRAIFEKEMGERGGLVFSISTMDQNQLVGFTSLGGFNWQARSAWVGIGIGDADYRGKGYGSDAMKTLSRYAFEHLNLNRINLGVFEYNPRAIRAYEKCGFVHEGRERQSLNRGGRRWDLLLMGLLRQDWESRRTV